MKFYIKDLIGNILLTTKYYIIKLYHKFENDHIWVLSSGIAFNILISIIPFLLIALTALGIYLDRQSEVEKILQYINNILPLQDAFKEKFMLAMVERVNELTSHTFLTGLIGFAALFWTMSGLFSTMRDVLNKIFDFNGYVNYFRGKLKDFLLIIIILVFFILSITFTSFLQIVKSYYSDYISNFIFISDVDILINHSLTNYLPIFVSLLTTYFMFFLLYKYIPQFIIPNKVIQLSTITSTILFELMKYLYTFYVINISSLKKIYGAYAFIVITIFWIYYISIIFTSSAAIGKIYIDKNNLLLKNKKN